MRESKIWTMFLRMKTAKIVLSKPNFLPHPVTSLSFSIPKSHNKKLRWRETTVPRGVFFFGGDGGMVAKKTHKTFWKYELQKISTHYLRGSRECEQKDCNRLGVFRWRGIPWEAYPTVWNWFRSSRISMSFQMSFCFSKSGDNCTLNTSPWTNDLVITN